MSKIKPLGEIINSTWNFFEKHWQKIVAVTAIFVGVQFVAIFVLVFALIIMQILGIIGGIPFITAMFQTGNDALKATTSAGAIIYIILLVLLFCFALLIIFAISFLFASWLNAILILLISQKISENLKFGQIFKIGWQKTGKVFLALLLIMLIVFVGFIFFIVPGVIFGLMFSQTLFLIVIDDMEIIPAMKKSYALIKGKMGTVFLYNLAAMAIIYVVILALNIVPVLGNLVSMFISVVITPLLMIFQYQIYKELVRIRNS